ncbi:hypothetical protein LK533_16500 [Sphingomonas sp. PL-96]|uniref:hypothetical protein n=1 Tax=Sphingomonas sp. PL-96 TaxID=2887201 RepID=UPI001E528088|nr:hypothetical protein [Sphingomonas sp. PL-96]MCC2978253.1 hypothetical protein [Sphingomonas sp. PL-96]
MSMIYLSLLVAVPSALVVPGAPTAPQTASASTSTPAAPVEPLTTDSTIDAIASTPAGKAVLDKDLPGLTEHPMYEAIKTMTLKQVQPLSNGMITDEALVQVDADLKKLKR